MNEINDNQTNSRLLLIVFVVMMMLSVLIIQLWNLQILSGRELHTKAEHQYARNIRIPALRGRIYSRNGYLLAGNRTSYNALFHLSEMHLTGGRSRSVKRILSEIRRAEKAIGRSSGVSEKHITYHLTHLPGIPMAVFKELNAVEQAKLAEIHPAIDGLELSADAVRWYPYRTVASHLIGFTGISDPSKEKDRGGYFYYLPDGTGREGLEKEYDAQLRGQPGKKLVVVNHRGFIHEVVGEVIQPKSAMDLILNVDMRLQVLAERLLNDKTGAVVMLDAENGAVLTAASVPGYDLNQFIPRITVKNYQALRKRTGNPFVNKAFQGTFTPGSIVKPLVALAMLENGVSPDHTVDCDGGTMFKDSSRIRCWAWKTGGHGPVAMTGALKVSCNDYFVESGMQLGVDKIASMMASAGFGKKTGVGLPEARGMLPDRHRWKHWSTYDTGLISMGQGKILVTPVQAACYAAALANGGKLWKPQLVYALVDPETGKAARFNPERTGQLQCTAEHLEIVRKGLYASVNEYGGGVRNAAIPNATVYGKSGTAEVGSLQNRSKNTWFIGYCRTPKNRLLAIAVLVTHGISGNKSAAPIAAEMFKSAIAGE